MGVPTSEVGYTPAMPRREDLEVHKGHVVALDQKKIIGISICLSASGSEIFMLGMGVSYLVVLFCIASLFVSLTAPRNVSSYLSHLFDRVLLFNDTSSL